MFLAKPLAKSTGRPVVFDALMSLHDTAVHDRGIVAEDSLKARLLALVDRWSCLLADLVLLDTEAHIEHYCARFDLPRAKFRRIFYTADDSVYRPMQTARGEDVFRVTYFGGYVPLHGTQCIVRAAEELADHPDIMFELIGNGQTYEPTRSLAEQLGLDNISFIKTNMPGEWLSPQELAAYVARADVCLGVFGAGQKVDWVIPSKIYVALAMKKPVITGDSPAIREALTHGQNVLLCERDNPRDLAEKVRLLCEDKALGDRIAEAGYDLFQRQLSATAIGRDFVEILGSLIEG
jgi:glycosyltransferase involved in cell wall biosynthesis